MKSEETSKVRKHNQQPIFEELKKRLNVRMDYAFMFTMLS